MIGLYRGLLVIGQVRLIVVGLIASFLLQLVFYLRTFERVGLVSLIEFDLGFLAKAKQCTSQVFSKTPILNNLIQLTFTFVTEGGPIDFL